MKNPEARTFIYYDIVYQDWIPPSKTKSEIAFLKKYAKKNQKTLDIGVGSGRHLVPLHQDGYQIEGIDILKEALNLVRSKDKTANVRLANIFSSKLPTNSFHLAYSMWNAFTQIATTQDKALKLLQIVFKILKPGGSFIFDIASDADPDDDWNYHHVVRQNGKQYILNWSLLDYNQSTRTTKCEEHIQVKDGKGHLIDDAKAIITQRWWTLEEIKKLSEKAGFKFNSTTIKNSDYIYYVLTKKYAERSQAFRTRQR